jgi:LmbE family N-acetylglucosaminyl deacetylase
MKILVLSPHTDDAELGCGATVAKHIDDGDDVIWVTFSSCQESLPEHMAPNTLIWECDDAMFALDVNDFYILNYPVRKFELMINELRELVWRMVNVCFKPDIIYTPWLGSLHQDHAVIAKITEQVTRHRKINVYGYYVSDDGVGFAPRHFVMLDDEGFRKHRMYPAAPVRKLAALECYQSQRQLRRWWNQGTFEATLKYWSAGTTSKYTEAFEVIRSVVE